MANENKGTVNAMNTNSKQELINGILSGLSATRERNEFLTANSYKDFETLTEQQAGAKACASFTMCGDSYVAYIAATAPYYDAALLVYDFETKRQIYIDTFLMYHGTEAERLEKMLNVAERKLFTASDILAASIKNYADYRAKCDFMLNIYPKRYKYVSAIYIGKPSEEQNNAVKSGYFCRCTLSYFEELRHVEDISKMWSELESKHNKQLAQDMDYLKSACIHEFYNFECIYGGRYNEAIAHAGIELKTATEEQRAVIKQAICEYDREAIKNI